MCKKICHAFKLLTSHLQETVIPACKQKSGEEQMGKFAYPAAWSDVICPIDKEKIIFILYNFSFIIITLNDNVHIEFCPVLLVKIEKKLKMIFLYGNDRNDALNPMQLI